MATCETSMLDLCLRKVVGIRINENCAHYRDCLFRNIFSPTLAHQMLMHVEIPHFCYPHCSDSGAVDKGEYLAESTEELPLLLSCLKSLRAAVQSLKPKKYEMSPTL